MKKDPYKSLRQECLELNLELPRLGLVLYTFGNVSVSDRKRGVVAIKPSGLPYKGMKTSDIVVVDLEGRRVAGRLNPSSDTATHLVLYREFTGLGGIVHTHSTHATAWAQACRPIPVLGTTHADHLHTPVPCTDLMTDEQIKADYETSTGRQIVDTFRSASLSADEVGMVLVAGHGPFTWGPTGEKAVYNAAVLEQLAAMAWMTLAINPSVPPLKDALIRKHFERKHGKNAYYGQKP
jgi:L-ribulose-5-phosphate 4-epimerase